MANVIDRDSSISLILCFKVTGFNMNVGAIRMLKPILRLSLSYATGIVSLEEEEANKNDDVQILYFNINTLRRSSMVTFIYYRLDEIAANNGNNKWE